MEFDNLKHEFMFTWSATALWASQYIDEVPDFVWQLRGTSEIALEMFEADCFYWEHYGWGQSLAHVLSPHDLGRDRCQQLSQRLLEFAPLGFVDVYPHIRDYAKGDFSKHDNMKTFVEESQLKWIEHLQAARNQRQQSVSLL